MIAPVTGPGAAVVQEVKKTLPFSPISSVKVFSKCFQSVKVFKIFSKCFKVSKGLKYFQSVFKVWNSRFPALFQGAKETGPLPPRPPRPRPTD